MGRGLAVRRVNILIEYPDDHWSVGFSRLNREDDQPSFMSWLEPYRPVQPQKAENAESRNIARVDSSTETVRWGAPAHPKRLHASLSRSPPEKALRSVSYPRA